MRNTSHETWIATLLRHVTDWRKANGWSRETIVQKIVEAHEQMNGPVTTGIVFAPPTRDTFERCKVNADRVYRWLDDTSKDNNLLPANFIPSILAAIPPAIRLNCVNDLFRCVGIGGRQISDGQAQTFNAVETLRDMLLENSDAQRAVADLVDGATHDELIAAQRELAESVEATQRALREVETTLAVGSTGLVGHG